MSHISTLENFSVAPSKWVVSAVLELTIARRDVHRASRTRVRSRDLDLIQLIDLDPKNRAALEAQPIDLEKPGLAQHYCVECAKYYETDSALQSHWRSKVHKRRCKELKQPAYTIEEAERAAGLGREGKRTTSIFRPLVASDDVMS